MSVTITITDPTVQEANALRAYLTALHGHTVGPVTSPKAYLIGEQASSLPAHTDAREEFNLAEIPPVVIPDSPDPDVAMGVTSAEDAGAPDFDSSGLPWDERIHASSRATISDGTWKKKRGVSPEEVAAVEVELRTLTATDAELIEQAEVLELPVPEAPAPVQEQSAPEAPPAPAQEQPPAPPVDTPNPFLAVMSRIGKSGMTKEQKDELLTAAGALDDKGNPSILVLNKKPELIAGFVALLDDAGV